MINTKYEEVFKLFLRLSADPIFAELTPALQVEDLVTLLKLSIPKFPYPKKDIRQMDDTNLTFLVPLDIDEIAILAHLMSLVWLDGVQRDLDKLEAPLVVSDFTAPTMSTSVKALTELRSKINEDVKDMILAYGRRSNTFNQSRFTELGGTKGGQV